MPGLFIANGIDNQPDSVPIAPMTPPRPHTGPANWIKVSAQQDGSFTVTNSRNGFTKTYRAQSGS